MKKKKPEGYYKGLRRKENLTIEQNGRIGSQTDISSP